ncbi:anti-sigma factor [Fodinisporobacter ferrooxydans]|uniref:Anti-sigma-W factor RsiW n=1 Tax=Fodinisporobacter ferrooxydans TaxID=2901836 RepID=A0ABY4CG71_9BACL|nr:anti-sigma factor [Alicyclobacillaceae bacterium MYW30-H2]
MVRDLHHEMCSQCLSYAFGQLSEQEREMFEKHLINCTRCRLEIQDIQPVLEALPYTVEPVKIPDDLKAKTLYHAFQSKAPVARSSLGESDFRPAIDDQTSDTIKGSGQIDKKTLWRTFISHPYGKAAVAVVAGLVLAQGISLWNIYSYQERLQADMPLQPADAMDLDRIYSLYAMKSTSAMTGAAYLTKTATGMQIVIQVHGALPLRGQEVYQAWLLKDGKRTNAGTFRVNAGGDGILVYNSANTIDFDNIGITKEPDPDSTSPRGPKVLGTKI